ncbi:MAG: AMP-binding protein [Lachnospiraceae bacterium]
MQTNILEYLERTVVRVPEKTAYADDKTGLTFRQVYDQSRAVGTYLWKQGVYKAPVLVFMKKSPKAVAAFFGTVYGGNFYVPLDEEMPAYRMKLIIENLSAEAVICDEKTKKTMEKLDFAGQIYLYEEMIQEEPDDRVWQRYGKGH